VAQETTFEIPRVRYIIREIGESFSRSTFIILAGGSPVFQRILGRISALIVLGIFLHAASALPEYRLAAQTAGPSNGVATFKPSSVDFGAVQLGTPSTAQQISLTNTGTGTLGSIAITATNLDYTISANTCGATLAVNAQCTITVIFTPSIQAPDPGGIVVTDDAATATTTAFLAGTGVGPLYVLPFQMVFDGQAVGTASPAQQAIFTNTADGAQGIDTLSTVGNAASDFTFTQNCNLTIPAGGDCPVNVVFKPSAAGPRTADLEAATNNGTIVSHLTGNGAIRHLQGFTANVLAPNDDSSSDEVPLPFSINFFGTTFNSLFVNNNGNVTFTEQLSDFTPTGLTTNNGNIPIIAAYWADVDTTGAVPDQEADAGSPPSAIVSYGVDTVNGHMAFGVDYENVGYYSAHTDKLNSFQLILIDRSDTGVNGAFDIEFNYDKIQWEVGDASGGQDGLCGTLPADVCTPAAVGYSNGTGDTGTNFQLPGSFVNGALLDNGPAATALIHQPGAVPGRATFQVRNGTVQSADLALTMTQAAPTVPAGSQQTYTLTVTNAGPNDATNVTILNTLPQQSSLVSATPSQGAACTGTLVLTCNLGTVANGGKATVTIIVSIVPDGVGTITDSATVSSDVTDPNTANNSASQTTTIGAATTFALTVTEGGTGTGTVTSAPAGISCPSGCSASFASGTAVTLTATPTNGSVFAGWGAGPCEGTGTCTFTITAATAVVANFTAGTATNFILTVTEAGTGSGNVTSAPLGINCPDGCSGSFASGTQVTLTETPSEGSVFAGWSGACSGSETCVVTVAAATAVTATFNNSSGGVVITIPSGGSTTATTTPGGTSYYGLIITCAPGQTGTVTLTATSSSPLISVNFIPNTIVCPGGSEQAVQLQTFCQGTTVTQTGSLPGGSGFGFGGGIGMLLVGLMMGGVGLVSGFGRSRRVGLTFALLALVTLGAGSCGGLRKSPTGQATPPGTYFISLTATLNGQSTTQPNFLTLVVK
jgi:uncharacterized repeat protein (TIGR01451 family)